MMVKTSLWTLFVAGPGLAAPPAPAAQGEGADTACVVMNMPTGGRLSPLDSISFAVGGGPVKLCFGRPSARGRTMLGGEDVPYGQLWRTGANEPTMLHATAPITVAGIAVDRGSYSLYTVPGAEEWTVIVNSSITQWGHVARYTSKVRAQEVGRTVVRPERLPGHVETMTFRTEARGDAVDLLLEWEYTRVRIPIRPGGEAPGGSPASRRPDR